MISLLLIDNNNNNNNFFVMTSFTPIRSEIIKILSCPMKSMRSISYIV